MSLYYVCDCFSYHACTHNCLLHREFTPELVDWYNRFKKGPKGHLLNIVFISSDEDDESWREYCADMPWHALDFKDRDKEVCMYLTFIIAMT